MVAIIPSPPVATRPPRRRRERAEHEYPAGDGKPMAETEVHLLLMYAIFRILRSYFMAHPEVYVGANLMVYYSVDDKVQRPVAPDVFVALKTATTPPRRVFRTWVDGEISWALELTSRKTRRTDMETKPEKYAAMGVPEYVTFDPTGDYLRPRLQGFRLVNGIYQPVPPDMNGDIISEVLGVRLSPVGDQIHLFEAATGRRLLDPEDDARAQVTTAHARAEAEHARAEAERARAEAAEAELAELRKRLMNGGR